VFLGLLAVLFFLQGPSEREIETSYHPLNVEIVRTRPAPPVAAVPPDAQTSDKAESELHSPTPSPPSSESSETKPADTQPAPAPLPPGKQPAPPWTESEIAAAKDECDRLLDKITVVAEPLPPEREGVCGAPAPRELRSVGETKVKFQPPATLRCPMIAALNTWISDKLQPAAKKSFGSPIARIVSGSYSCRNRYGLARAPVSEHAFMNAIDISAFVLENGKVIKISHSWAPPPDEVKEKAKSEASSGKAAKAITAAASKLGAHDVALHDDDKTKRKPEDSKEGAKDAMSKFLHLAHDDACAIFGTVLGPDANAAHHDHFHLDMKARKYRSICE
jgi:hypothetical protein